MQIAGAHSLMMGCRVVLGEIVGLIALTWFPVDAELILFRPAPYPVEAHVHGFGAALFNSVIDNAASCGVVSFHWCCGLRMTHVNESLAYWTGFLAVVE